MLKYPYECPVCNNLMTLVMDLQSCPFKRELAGQCDKCNNKVEMYEDDYKDWVKGKEAKGNVD